MYTDKSKITLFSEFSFFHVTEGKRERKGKNEKA